MTISSVAAVHIPAGTAQVVAPSDPARSYLRLNNSTMSDITYSTSAAAAQSRDGFGSTGAQPDLELSDVLVGGLAAAEIWAYNHGTTAAIVAAIYGYRV